MFKKGQVVVVADIDKVKNDELLGAIALEIIEANEFKGEISKVEDGIHFVGFKNEKGWVTQGYKADEIKEDK